MVTGNLTPSSNARTEIVSEHWIESERCYANKEEEKTITAQKHSGSRFIYKTSVYTQNTRNPGWWNPFHPMAFEACLNLTIVCCHSSHWLVVYTGKLEVVSSCIRAPADRLTTMAFKMQLLNAPKVNNSRGEKSSSHTTAKT